MKVIIDKSLKTTPKFRCNCPITSALDIVGDKWTLVIIKQMLLQNMKTFKEFSTSKEAIASNILASRLKMLEELQIISKEKPPNNKKTNLYLLTDKGLELTPLIIELALWSCNNLQKNNRNLDINNKIDFIKKNKKKAIKKIKADYIKNNNLSPHKDTN